MTSVDGSNATDGGARWMYDVTLYPKNLTGIPTLKRPRENQNDTGKNNGSNDITDGYAHTGTRLDGDADRLPVDFHAAPPSPPNLPI